MPAYPLTQYVVQIAVADNGNPSIQVLPRSPEFLPHPSFPPIALPGSEFPDALSARDYAARLLQTAGLLEQGRDLVFIGSGYTLVQGRRYAALSAPLPDAEPAEQEQPEPEEDGDYLDSLEAWQTYGPNA